MRREHNRKHLPRLLVVEDDQKRIEQFQEWIPEEFLLTFVRSAGRALRVLELDAGRVYAGILLDHDLNQSVAADSELQLSGRQVVARLVQLINQDVPILIHSINLMGAQSMEKTLVNHGFDVTRVPFDQLDQTKIKNWLTCVRDEWF